jgi:hypothetical protein
MRQIMQLSCTRYCPTVKPGGCSAEAAVRFGVPFSAEKQAIIAEGSIEVGPGDVVLITGPSGSGKSSAIAALARQAESAVDVNRVAFPRERAIIDSLAPWAEAGESIGLLTACGLGEARLWLRPYEALSEGERFRARLARAIALQMQASSPGANRARPTLLFCDESGPICIGESCRRSPLISANSPNAGDCVSSSQPATTILQPTWPHTRSCGWESVVIAKSLKGP